MSPNPGDPDAAGVSAEMSEGYDESVEVVGSELKARFTGNSVVLSEAELTAVGSCS